MRPPTSPASCLVLLAVLAVFADAAKYSTHNPNEGDLPGHSDKYTVAGSSGYGCQVADHEVMPWRTPDRSGEDDGSLWTGETVVKVGKYVADEGEEPKTVCNGTFYLPTVAWIGPYLQGQNGDNGDFAFGMLAFETNDTDKSDAWHVYRPCDAVSGEEDSDEWHPFDSAFKLKTGVSYSESTVPGDSTVGLRLISRPQGRNNGTIFFNGTFNDIKDSGVYYGQGESGIHFWSFSSSDDLNCTRVSEGEDSWDASKGASAKIEPGSVISGILSNNSIVLHMTSTTIGKAHAGVEEPKPRVTNVGSSRTDIEITFSGQFDSRNSSQNLIADTASPAITFSAGRRHVPCIPLLSAAAGLVLYSLSIAL